QSVNFVTSHDGFTLNDLVSYNEKHNGANRENNRDGANDNFSWNCGIEGPSDDPQLRPGQPPDSVHLGAHDCPEVAMGHPALLDRTANILVDQRWVGRQIGELHPP